ncbi:MAG TPA: lamin tail domain-containing protein [Verrucomicrobiae bacterium]|nr:lamin tail domain-containing protein [Verrucomicrobiae bacterium]
MTKQLHLGWIACLSGALSAHAAVMTPINLTGFNRDLVIENVSSGPPYTTAEQLNPGEGLAFYQSGLPGKTRGLPESGEFVSVLPGDDGTVFQFQPYAGNNALVLSSDTAINSGTLTLTTPASYSRIAIIANSASGGGTPNLTLHFSDSSTYVTTYNAQDWFNNSGFALQGFERINLNNGSVSGGSDNPRLYQTTLDLAAIGATSKSLVSITFEQASGAGSTAIYAISGEFAPPSPAMITSSPTNATVNELGSVSFSATVSGSPAPALQWFQNGAKISGATNSTYVLSPAPLSANNADFWVVATNLANGIPYSATSASAKLTVIADTARPVLLGAQSLGLSQVQVRFLERIKSSTASTVANYAIQGTNGAVFISSAALDASQSNVVLNVSPLVNGAGYTLTVNNLADQSAAANVIAANSQTNFTASIYAPVAIGNPVPPGGMTVVSNGFNLSGGGTDLGGSMDQFQFSYQERTGDFDVKVRLDSLSLADAWSEAGMVAREDLSTGARSASVMATPTISGCYFQSRLTTNGNTTLSGSAPVNYPNTWLRLKRAGSVFTGFASFDGQNWTQLGSATMVMPVTIYFGFAVSSHNPGQTATAAFRDFANVTTANIVGATAREPLGQANRRTSLVISEIMYHPIQSNLEFVELFNSRGEPEDLSGYKLGGDISYTFPNGTVIPGGGFLVIARSPANLQNAYGIANVLGPFTGSLPNSSGIVTLINQAGGVFLEMEYSDEPPWPVAADGAGHSLVLTRPSLGQNDPAAWTASDAIGGSPGRIDPFTPDPWRNVVINEFLAHTDPPDVDYVELYNPGAESVDLSGCVLTDDPETNKYTLPPGTILPAHGFLSFTATTLNFNLDAVGEDVFLKNPTGTRVIDAVRFQSQENGIATGRYPDGNAQFYRLSSKTPGAANATLLVDDVVINELMYHPISENDDDQYVELYNRGTSPVNLGGWKLEDGISYTFPSNVVIAAGDYIVVARSATRLRSNYSNLNAANCLGDFSGRLSHGGERVILTKPDTHKDVVDGETLTNIIDITVDEVTYNTGGRWPALADGDGSSLELIDPRSNHRLAPNWADSDETSKAPWTHLSVTGTVDNGSTTADELQILLMGAGECLVDNVEVRMPPVNQNLIANSSFETDASGWTAEGTESPSSLETSEGYNSSKSYHIRAIERGDNQINRVRTLLTSSIPSGTTGVTIKADVRWLKGHPQIILRLRGNWLECAGDMTLPPNPGTPGAINSRYAANAGPAITDVQHSPVLPAANEPILVTARVHDPDGTSSVSLKYRIDPSASVITLNMKDDGTGGDVISGDGVFSATIPGQSDGVLVAFYVQATDGFTPPAANRFPNDAPTRECLVRVGEQQPTGNFPVYRLWMTQATLDTWKTRKVLDNTPLDVTFVLGNSRVIYNAQALYAGSPYIAPGYSGPTSGRCGYSVSFADDDLFLGEDALTLDWPGGHGNETTALQEQMGYWIADRLNLPFSHRYTIRLHVNGVTDEARRAVFEAVMQPDDEFREQWSPAAPDGDFFKIDRAFEMSDSGSVLADPQPRLQNFTTTGGVKKREKYRWNFLSRGNSRVSDYTDIFALVDALNASGPEPYTSATLGLVDVEEWMRVFATEHIIVNFDAYGHEIGKNMYAFKPDSGKWQLYMFDLDWLMLAAAQTGGRGPGQAQLFNSEDPTISRMYSFAPFQRAYWRAVLDAVNGPLDPAKANPVMDAKYQSLVANGILWCDDRALTDPTAVKTWFSQRRAFLLNQLASVDAEFAVTSSTEFSTGTNLVTISGTAPISVKSIKINGQEWAVTWNGVTSWTLKVVLNGGVNMFNLQAFDANGNLVGNANNPVTITNTNATVSPIGVVVFNEIMSQPPLPDAEFIELFNTSSNAAFDLSGWTVNGLSYTFPGGSVIAPRQMLVLAKNRTAFSLAYGADIPVFGEYAGNLQLDGETLSLLLPDGTTVVDRVRYEPALPWANATNGTSLQLVDAIQDNSRAANWKAGTNQPQWIYYSTTDVAHSSRLYIYLQGAGDIYLDDIKLVAGATPEAGANLLSNGDFESALTGPWNVTANFASSALSTSVKRTGNSSLHVIATAAGTGTGNAIYQNISPGLVNGQTYSLSFWYSPGSNSVPLTLRLSGATGVNATLMPDAADATGIVTPGRENSVAATLPEFPPLWLNEVQPNNITGPINNAGAHTPWVELRNASSDPVSLSGFYLSDSYANPIKWAFPPDAVVPANGFLVVWCDGQIAQTTALSPHANFVLADGTGSVVLARKINGNVPQIIDYLNYANLSANWSYGDVPDGQPFFRQSMFYATAGATNNGTSAPLTISINEWMADNSHTLQNPFDGSYADWFELYNYGDETLDLGGYFLTGDLTDKTKFEIPNNGHYLVPPHGFMVVWADDNDAENSPDRPELHVNFKLSKSGDAIGLFAADGTAIDAVSFGAESTDVSHGRFPDGAANVFFMPTPTPGLANLIPNTAPSLAPISNKEIILGQTLDFVASATDLDQPPQDLTFSLASGAPAGAQINSVTGHFTWTPTIAPSTNVLNIVVTDSGVPSLSATQTFNVVVHPLPQLSGVRRSGTDLIFSWGTVSGQTYYLEFKDDLNAAEWTQLGAPILGNGNSVSVTNALISPHRFFRLRLQP